MIKIINSVPYSTDSSCRLGYFQHRTILDPAYHREELYITRQGTYFLYVEGRENSPYCFQGDPFPAAVLESDRNSHPKASRINQSESDRNSQS